MTWLYVVVTVAAGCMLPLQAAINAQLARFVGSPVWAAAISGIVLTAALIFFALATLHAGPRTATLEQIPWWAWSGGICGAVLLCATAALAPQLGTANLIALVVAGQTVCSLGLEYFGVLGVRQHQPSPFQSGAAVLISRALR